MLWLLLVSWEPELGFGGQPLFPHYEPLTDRLSEEAQPLAYLTEGGPRQSQGGCPSPGRIPLPSPWLLPFSVGRNRLPDSPGTIPENPHLLS